MTTLPFGLADSTRICPTTTRRWSEAREMGAAENARLLEYCRNRRAPDWSGQIVNRWSCSLTPYGLIFVTAESGTYFHDFVPGVTPSCRDVPSPESGLTSQSPGARDPSLPEFEGADEHGGQGG